MSSVELTFSIGCIRIFDSCTLEIPFISSSSLDSQQVSHHPLATLSLVLRFCLTNLSSRIWKRRTSRPYQYNVFFASTHKQLARIISKSFTDFHQHIELPLAVDRSKHRRWERAIMATATAKTGHFLANVLGIKLDDPSGGHADAITRGESVFSTKTTDTFVEEEPSSWDWVKETLPGWKGVGLYARSLFPFTYWIGRYNVQWLIGDLVAGYVKCLRHLHKP